MKIKLQTGDLKMGEQISQLPGSPHAYVGQGKQSLADLKITPHGVPSGGLYSVDCSYDARPINTVDINTIAYDPVYTNYSGGNVAQTGNLSLFTPAFPGQDTVNSNVVPDGYVFILRRVSNFYITNYPGSHTTTQRLMTQGTANVIINRAQVKGSGMDAGWGASNDMWVLVDEGQTLSISYSLSVMYAPYGNGYWYIDTTIQCSIYGHLIQKSGAPLQFTAANEKEGKVKVTTTPGMPR